jgi:ABC-2 type transport system permease protein
MREHDSQAVAGHHRGAVADRHARAQTWPGSSVFTQLAVLTRRAALQYLSDPRAVVMGLLQPIVILYLVVSAFSKISSHVAGMPTGISYFQFVLPAVLVDGAIQTSLLSGAALIDELRNGIVVRLRSLPIQLSTILIARSFSGMVRTGVQTVIVLVLAELTHGNVSRSGLTGLVAVLGLTMLIGWCLGWVFIAAGMWIRRAETLLSLAILLTLPLMFASSAWIPLDSLPTALAAVARVNPATYAINAERALFLNTAGSPVGTAATILPPIVICVVLGAAAAYTAVRLFRRPLQVARQ